MVFKFFETPHTKDILDSKMKPRYSDELQNTGMWRQITISHKIHVVPKSIEDEDGRGCETMADDLRTVESPNS